MEINKDKIMRAFEDNPVAFLASAGAVLMGVSRIIEAYGNYKGSSAFARDVNRRVRQARKNR